MQSKFDVPWGWQFTKEYFIFIINLNFRHELWKMQLAGSVLHISCDSLGNVGLALMDGSIALLNVSICDFRDKLHKYQNLIGGAIFFHVEPILS